MFLRSKNGDEEALGYKLAVEETAATLENEEARLEKNGQIFCPECYTSYREEADGLTVHRQPTEQRVLITVIPFIEIGESLHFPL